MVVADRVKVRRVNPMMDDESWKPQVLEELSLAKLGFHELNGIELEEIDFLIEEIATS